MSTQSMPTSTTQTDTPNQIYLILAAGIIAVAFAAIFIRLAQDVGMPSPVIAAGRLTISALILTPFALRRHLRQIITLQRRDLLFAVGAGFFLAIHFATWISSLEYASVLISTVFVTTSPFWVAMLEVIFLRAKLTRMVIFGLLVATGGGLLIGIAGGNEAAGPNPVLGATLALIAAAAVSVYMVIGRKIRASLSLLPYIWMVYSFAALFLIAFLIVTTTPITGHNPQGYLWVLMLGLIPQLIGHSAFNYVLKYLSATFVGIATQLEPIFSALAAFILFQERPLPLQLVGSAAVLAGVVLALLGGRKPSTR